MPGWPRNPWTDVLPPKPPPTCRLGCGGSVSDRRYACQACVRERRTLLAIQRQLRRPDAVPPTFRAYFERRAVKQGKADPRGSEASPA
jgi:hypothetical protein